MKKLLLALALLATMVACSPTPTPEQTQTVEQNPNDPEKGYAEILVDYKIINSDTRDWVKKIRVDGCEYLMFGSGLANPPTVIHSEKCPCKQITKQ